MWHISALHGTGLHTGFGGLIQSGLFFLLGFLIAGFLALLVAPTIWRRAVFLTRKRIESAIPLTANELQADKDKLRAESAMAITRVETALDKQRAKNVELAEKLAEQSEEIKLHRAEIASQTEANLQLDKTIVNTNEKLAARDADIEGLKFELSTASAELEARGGELESLTSIHEEAEKRIVEQQEKMAALELDVAKQTTTVADLRDKRRADQEKVRETRAEGKATAELLRNERSRAAEIEKKYERLVADKSDVEVKLARRDKDLTRLKEKQSGEAADQQELQMRLSDAAAERKALDKELADLTLKLNRIAKAVGDDNPEKAVSALQVKLTKMELEFKALGVERDRLKSKLAEQSATAKTSAALGAAKASATSSQKLADGDAALRDQLGQLAAEVVHMTALVEGDDSRINAILKSPDAKGGLAERIKALKRAAEKANAG